MVGMTEVLIIEHSPYGYGLCLDYSLTKYCPLVVSLTVISRSELFFQYHPWEPENGVVNEPLT